MSISYTEYKIIKHDSFSPLENQTNDVIRLYRFIETEFGTGAIAWRAKFVGADYGCIYVLTPEQLKYCLEKGIIQRI